MQTTNSFDQLVSEISQTERIELLKKLEAVMDPESQSLETPKNDEDDSAAVDIIHALKNEPFLIRLWIWIKSIFTSSDLENTYNEHLLISLSHKIEQEASDVVDYRRGILQTTFYNKLLELKNVADFFKPGLSVYEENQGNFFVLMGSLFMPELESRMDAEVSPYSLPLTREVTTELRASLIRKMDDILQTIPQIDRSRLYAAVRSIEWLKHFCRLPFEKFLSRFYALTPGTYTCQLDSASSDLALFSKVLCSGTRLPAEIFESLYLFSSRTQEQNQDIDLKEAAADYLRKSMEQVSLIKMFITTVPIRKVTALAMHSSFWTHDQLDGAEDWFVKYKSQWRKIFDQKWESWLRDKRKEQNRQRIESLIGIKDFPLVPHRPWADIWGGLTFAREYSLGFIYAFFDSLYPVYSKWLKILMLEGEFQQRENRIEYTDSYNEFNHLVTTLSQLKDKLSIKGIYGSSFTNASRENVRTIQNQAKIDSVMMNIETEANSLITLFLSIARSMQMVLGGILSETRDSRYDSLINIAAVQGKGNSAFRDELANVRRGFIEASDILKELDGIEASLRR